jgi:hypothetical protein
MEDIRSVIASFTKRLSAIIEDSVIDKARRAALAAFGNGPAGPKRPGRLAKVLTAAVRKAPVKARKKAPVQLCPVPGCKNPAAPIFGMVCAKHKDLPKAKIKKYRERRRLAKLNGATHTAPPKRRAKRVARKPKRAVRVTRQARKRKIVRPQKAAAKPTVSSAPPSATNDSPPSAAA